MKFRIATAALAVCFAANVQAAGALSDILVSYRLDPWLISGNYVGGLWASPAVFGPVNQGGTTFTVQTRAEGLDAQGQVVPINAEWVPVDPGVTTVWPVQASEVTLTVNHPGRSVVQVTSQGVTKELTILATPAFGGIATTVQIDQRLATVPSVPIRDHAFFVAKLYQDLLNRAPDPAAWSTSVSQLNSGAATREQVATALLTGPELRDTSFYIAKLYMGLLQRDPDFAGFSNILNLMRTGSTQATVLAGFMSTPEFQTAYGTLDASAFVTALYRNLLGRAPDPAGFSYWTFLVNFGAPRAGVVQGFIQSPEYEARVRNRANVNLAYLHFLRRTGEPAGLNYWTVSLNFGVPLVNAVGGFIGSPEYLARF